MVSPWKAVEQQLFVLVPFRPYPKILRGARRTRKTPSPFYLMLNYFEGFFPPPFITTFEKHSKSLVFDLRFDKSFHHSLDPNSISL